MDVYEYFNSWDVAEHCKKLGRSFSGREMAYLIWQSNHHTLHQKIAAWMELIQTIPDEMHKDFEEAGCCGLHDFLRKYIDRLLQFLADFEENPGEFAYSYERLYTDSNCRFNDESPLFANYDLCIATAAAEAAEKNEITAFRVKKRKICGESATYDEFPMLFMTRNAEPMDVHVAPYRGEEDMLVTPFGFYGMFVDIPTPFKRGDIVIGVDLWGHHSGPMVVDKLPVGHGEDYIDMCVCLWELDPQGRLCHNKDICYLSLEYYHGNLEKQTRFLYALRNYCKDKLPLAELLRSYSVTLLEFFAEKRMDFYGWAEGAHRLSGLVEAQIHIS